MRKRKPKSRHGRPTGRRRLTNKQMAFCKWYVSSAVNLNASEAARRAGYQGSENTLGTVGYQNMQNPAIREEIDSRLRVALSGAEITVEKVLRDLELTRVAAMESCQFGNAVRCSELQGKYLKMFSERIEHVETIEDFDTEQLIQLLKEICESGDVSLLEMIRSAEKKSSYQ